MTRITITNHDGDWAIGTVSLDDDKLVFFDEQLYKSDPLDQVLREAIEEDEE